MKIVDQISVAELKEMSKKMFDDIVKADVDVAKRIVVLDMAMHFDGEQYLLSQGSDQSDLWGINLYPDDYGTEDFIEFDSMINIRPSQGNRTRSVEDETIQDIIRGIIGEVVHE